MDQLDFLKIIHIRDDRVKKKLLINIYSPQKKT